MASEANIANQVNQDDGVSIDLPAPEGWKKIFTPKRAGTPRRNDIVFISPTGEEIRSRKQLEQYLKSHPGNLSASDFDWGTGDTPRRSARISQKSKATESPEGASPQKKQRSSSKKGAKEKKDDIDGETEAVEEKLAAAASEETKASEEVEMKDAEDEEGDKSKGEEADKEGLTTEDTDKESEQIVKLEKQEADNKPTSSAHEKESLPTPGLEENVVEAEKQVAKPEGLPELENQDADETKISNTKEEQAGNNSLSIPGVEENKEEAEKQVAESETPAMLPVPNEAMFSEKEEAAVVKETFPEVTNAEVEVEMKSEEEAAKLGTCPDKGVSTEKEKVGMGNVGEVKPDNDGCKEEGQEVSKSMENHAARSEEAPPEPQSISS